MTGSFLNLYIPEAERHQGRLLWEWLLERANKLGLRGGSAFKAMAGFGRHHTLHEERFFELAGSLSVELQFLVSDAEAQQLLDLLRQENIRVFYALVPAQFGMTGAAETK